MATTRGDVRTRLDGLGVYYGWLVVAVCFASLTVTFGTIYSFSVFFGHILMAFGLSHADTSVVFSLQSVVTFGSGTYLGFVVDRYGARRLAVVAAGLGGLGLLGASQSPFFWGVAVSYGAVAASGFSIAIVIGYVTPVRWFERRRGLAVGIATAGGGAGLLLVPPAAAMLIDAVGWQPAYLGLMALFLGTLLATALVIADRPADLGVDASSEFADPGAESTDDAPLDLRDQVRDVLDVALSWPFALVLLGFLFAFLPNYMILVHLVEYTGEVGLGRGVGVLALSVIGGMNVVGKTAGGAVADRVGTTATIAACIAGMALATIGLALLPLRVAVLGLAVVFGFGYGGSLALLTPMLAALFGRLDLSALFGITMLAFAVAGSLGPYVAGAGFDALGTFAPPFVAGGLVGLMGSGLIVAASRLASDRPAPTT